MGATSDRREGGGGQSTLDACVQPVAVEFLLLLFFAQTKEKKGHPRGQKEAPQRYLPPGGFAQYKRTDDSILTEKLSDTISLSYLLWSKAVGE